MSTITQPILAHRISATEHSETIVFVHGWPDDASMWDGQVQHLEKSFRCVAVTLPNFGDTMDRPGGFAFGELFDRLHATIEHIQPDGGSVFLVTHDWGAYIGYLYERAHPERIKKMVSMDVGGETDPPSVVAALMIVAYQWTLISCWLIGGLLPPLGNAITRVVGLMMGLAKPRRDRMRSRFNYPYFRLWKDLLLPWRRKNLPLRYEPQCPIFYIYGGRKPLMFHSRKWLDLLARTGGGHACVEDGDHWFMDTHPEPVNQWIEAWFTG